MNYCHDTQSHGTLKGFPVKYFTVISTYILTFQQIPVLSCSCVYANIILGENLKIVGQILLNMIEKRSVDAFSEINNIVRVAVLLDLKLLRICYFTIYVG